MTGEDGVGRGQRDTQGVGGQARPLAIAVVEGRAQGSVAAAGVEFYSGQPVGGVITVADFALGGGRTARRLAGLVACGVEGVVPGNPIAAGVGRDQLVEGVVGVGRDHRVGGDRFGEGGLVAQAVVSIAKALAGGVAGSGQPREVVIGVNNRPGQRRRLDR